MPSIQRTLLVATVVAALFFLRSGSPNEGPPACIEAPGAWKATFIDLGANSGDSFLGFMDDPSVNWPFTFPRPCGFQKSDFKAWLFEANKAFDEPLAALSKIFAKEKGMKVNIMGRTVVSVADGPASFSADGRVEPNCNRCGSSSKPWEGQAAAPVNPEVVGVDFANWLQRHVSRRWEFVIIKMDIEGSEYEVIPRLWETGAWRLIDVLVVELHHWHKGYTDEEKNRTALVLEQMRMNGVYVPQNYFSDA